MNIVNSVIKCYECMSLLEKPTFLPCGSSVCYKHLKNLQNDVFFCKSCDDDHHVEPNKLVVNKALEILIEANLEKFNFGPEYKAAFDECNKLDETIKDMETLRNDSSHFIKQTIDKLKNTTELIREEYKLKIDEKADKIIQQLDDYEAECNGMLDSSQFKTAFAKLDKNIKQIRQDLADWQKTLNNFGSKEYEWKMIKQKSKESNFNLEKEKFDFKNQFLIGKLNNYFSSVLSFQEINLISETKLSKEMEEFKDIYVNYNIENSKIIDNAKMQQLIELCNISIGKKLKLIYRGSEHGFTAKDFHSKCDNVPNTLTIIKSTCGFVFGGFTSQAWESNAGGIYKNDSSAYLFSLVNPQNRPEKLNTQNAARAIVCNTNYGPIFGNGNDLLISFSSNNSLLGSSYPMRNGNLSYLTKLEKFSILDIDIYQIV